MFTVIIKNEKEEVIEKNTREFSSASEAVNYVFKLTEHYESKEKRTIEMKTDTKLVLTKYTYRDEYKEN